MKKLLMDLYPKAKTLFFPSRGAGTITNITGLVNEHELSIIEMKTLENLVHESIGIYAQATLANPKVVVGGGTAVFRVVELQQWGAYTAANRKDAGDLKKSEIKVKADIVGSEVSRYEIETLDLDGLDFQTRDAYISYVAAGINTTLAALMDAHYLDVFVQEAKAAEAATPATPLLVKNPNWLDLSTGTTDDAGLQFAIKKAYRQVARAQTDVSRIIDKYNIGSKQSDYAAILHKDIFNDFLLVIAGRGATNQQALDLTGSTSSFGAIAGLNGVVKDHVFLGKTIAAGAAFSKDTAFDFSKVVGLIAHKEAAFVAIQGLKTTGAIDPNSGNQVYVSKFNYFKKLVRKELFRLLVTGTLQ